MFKGTLKPYQVEAVEKMVKQKNILVAYEMGLGKTPMTIAAIEELRGIGKMTKTVLVLCLSSLKYQWQKEIVKFSDSSSIVIDGNPKQRKEQYQQLISNDYVIMNYEQIVNDWDIIKQHDFDAIICDEATAIKGFKAKRAKKVKELSKKIPVRFALTGTPVENGRPEEIYSIMQFVDPKILGRFDLFDKAFIIRNQFGGVDRYVNLPTLHSKVSSYSVRKSQNDEDVKPYLPDAVYREPLLISLDSKSQKLYNFIVSDLIELLIEARDTFGTNFSIAAHYGQSRDLNDPANEMRGQIMSRITALRMLCSNPAILQVSKKMFDNHTGKGSAYISSLGDKLEDITKKVKQDAVVQYVKDHLSIDPKYKVVIFSSYLWSVTQLFMEFKDSSISSVMYTGEMNAKEKEVAKLDFQSNIDTRVLISSDAGGYGVDLPQANLLINYDQPWSAGLAVQRNGRINRTSSEWPTITIQDILIKNSIEQRQYDMLNQKKIVAGAILDGVGINDKGGIDFTAGSLIDFLSNNLNQQ
jgi:hypothetical protein